MNNKFIKSKISEIENYKTKNYLLVLFSIIIYLSFTMGAFFIENKTTTDISLLSIDNIPE